MTFRHYFIFILVLMRATPGAAAQSGSCFEIAWGGTGTGNGLFNLAQAVAVDSAGNVYVADQGNCLIQKFDPTGKFLFQWGSFGTGVTQFAAPSAIAVNKENHVYVVDTGYSRVKVFDSVGNFLRQWGSFGTGNGMFEEPWSIGLDASGNIYVTDYGNNRIEKFDENGTFLTEWGSAGTGNGQFMGPDGVAISNTNPAYVYVSDSRNFRVQKFDTQGNYLGQWGGQASGEGQLEYPTGLAVDGGGNVLVTDWFAYPADARIIAYSPSGTFLYQFGSPGTGFGQIENPQGLAVDTSGAVYVADTGNDRIQKFVPCSLQGVGVAVACNQAVVKAGQTLLVEYALWNETSSTVMGDLWIAVEIENTFYFLPCFCTTLSSYKNGVSLPSMSNTEWNLVFSYENPGGAGGLVANWYGALFQPGTFTLISGLAGPATCVLE